MDPMFFVSQSDLHDWFAQHHDDAKELLVGFWKTKTAKPSITYQEALDEALSFGWIDGVRRSLGDESYTIRFTPRKPRSIWSAINIKRVGELTEAGRMQPAGLQAFNERDPERTGRYSNEQAEIQLGPTYEAQFRAQPQAWDFFQAQPPSYRKPAIWWVMSAKKEETRQKRLTTLIADSATGRRIPALTPPGKRPAS
ncbi:MAG: YdeI/OmpD-associated family protein [Thermomicrobiales bacterium]